MQEHLYFQILDINWFKKPLKNKIQITSIPGPSAITASIVISGAKTDKFLFLGLLQRKKNDYVKILKKYSSLNIPIIVFEKSSRIKFLVKIVFDWYENAKVIITRELTKFMKKSYMLTSITLKNILKMISNLKENLQLY